MKMTSAQLIIGMNKRKEQDFREANDLLLSARNLLNYYDPKMGKTLEAMQRKLLKFINS